MLQVRELIFDYSDKLLLQNVNFSVKQKTVLHIKGDNGVGKTTLLKLLAGLLEPLSGQILYEGTRCYVGHKNGVNMRLTPEEHLRFDLGVTDARLCEEMLARLNLYDVRDMQAALLSAGQKRRMGLLRLLNTNAMLWLLDEPFVALDSAGIDVLGDLMKLHLAQAGSIVLTSHQPMPFALAPSMQQELVL